MALETVSLIVRSKAQAGRMTRYLRRRSLLAHVINVKRGEHEVRLFVPTGGYRATCDARLRDAYNATL